MCYFKGVLCVYQTFMFKKEATILINPHTNQSINMKMMHRTVLVPEFYVVIKMFYFALLNMVITNQL